MTDLDKAYDEREVYLVLKRLEEREARRKNAIEWAAVVAVDVALFAFWWFVGWKVFLACGLMVGISAGVFLVLSFLFRRDQ